MGASSTTPRLLVFGINYDPEPTGTALNTTWQTRSLAADGWAVDMVTGTPHYPSWKPGPRPPDTREGNPSVRRKPHFVPRTMTAAQRGIYELTWVMTAFPTAVGSPRPDAVIGIVPSLGGALLAAVAARRYGVPFALIVQDVIGRAAVASGIQGAAAVSGPVSALELAIARRAAGVAIVADGFEDYFLGGGVEPGRIHKIRNPARLGPVLHDRATMRHRLGWPEDRFVVLHSGSMGFKQGLESVIDAAARAGSDSPVTFVFQGDGAQRPMLEARVAALGIRNVEFLPLASEQEFPSILAAADALLLNQRSTVVNMSMPAKLAIYFAAGVPVIAAVREDDETAADIRRADAGVIVPPESPDALLDGIRRLYDDPERAAKMGANGQRYAREALSEDAVLGQIARFLRASFQNRMPDRQIARVGSEAADDRRGSY